MTITSCKCNICGLKYQIYQSYLHEQYLPILIVGFYYFRHWGHYVLSPAKNLVGNVKKCLARTRIRYTDRPKMACQSRDHSVQRLHEVDCLEHSWR